MRNHILGSLRLSSIAALALVATIAGTGCAESDSGPEAQESDLVNCTFGLGPTIGGEIEVKYRSLGGCLSVLGPPVHGEQLAPDGKGRYVGFVNGSIYFRPDIGAHVVRGLWVWSETRWQRRPVHGFRSRERNTSARPAASLP